MSDINEEEPVNTDIEPTTTDNEPVNTDNEIINKITTINLNNEQKTKPKRKIIPPTRPKRDPLPKVRLTTAERNKIIYDYDRGVNNPIWEVIITKTNKKVVRRKKDPEANFSPISGLTKSEPQPQLSQQPSQQNTSVSNDPAQNKDWMESIQYYNVQNSFNEQLLKQLDELNNKITHQNNKHKKLKTKYKKLKKSIFSDDSDNDTRQDEHVVNEVKYNEPIINEPEYEYEPQPIRRKLNLRDVTDFTKYGFSPL